MSDTIEVFISYSKQDKELRDGLLAHLDVLRGEGIITWHDRQILPGTRWDEENKARLNAADIILLLLSPDFLATDYCTQVEIPEALRRHEAGEATVMPVILRHCGWQFTDLAAIQAYPEKAKPIKSWMDIDEAFTDVVDAVYLAATEIKKRRKQQQAAEQAQPRQAKQLMQQIAAIERLRQEELERQRQAQREQEAAKQRQQELEQNRSIDNLSSDRYIDLYIKVFISYSWDSEQHKDKILALSDSLRRCGIDCQIDRYHQSPPNGWYRWMMDQIEESDYVLVVCTEKYNLRYRNREEQGQGRGVTWEGGLIIANLYDGQGINEKFIPVLLSHEGEGHIPRSIQAYTVYRLFDNDSYDLNQPGGYQDLYRHLTKQPAVVPAQLGKPRRLLPSVGASSSIGSQGEIIQDETLQVSDSDDLSSDRHIYYTRLRNLLKAGKWREADKETYRLMITTVGKEEGQGFDEEDLLNFPCEDLKTIDRLWVHYSKEKFGFSVQKRIWKECGSPTEYGKNWIKFGDCVGWRKEGKWLNYDSLTFDLEKSLLGKLPCDWLDWGEIKRGYFGLILLGREDCKL